jgi:hypothetical protein
MVYITNLFQLDYIFTNVSLFRLRWSWLHLGIYCTMTEYDHHDIFYYITDPEWDPVGKETATNTITYCRLIESGAFKDEPEGTHVLIVHGKILKYYEKDISWEEYEELEKRYPGKYFAPIIEKTVLLRRFSANHDNTIRKEWQVSLQLIHNSIGIIDRYCLNMLYNE